MEREEETYKNVPANESDGRFAGHHGTSATSDR